MLPVNRNLRRQEVEDSSQPFGDRGSSTVTSFFVTAPTNNFACEHGLFDITDTYHRNKFSHIDEDAQLDETTSGKTVALHAYVPRTDMAVAGSADYYSNITDYSYSYGTFNAVPATLISSQWSATDAGIANYPYEHTYADTSKPNYLGESYVYDTLTAPLATGATFSNYVGSSAWLEKVKAAIPQRSAARIGGKPEISGGRKDFTRFTSSAASSIDVEFITSTPVIKWGQLLDISSTHGAGATCRSEVRNKWLMYQHLQGVGVGVSLSFQTASPLNLTQSIGPVFSTDGVWEMTMGEADISNPSYLGLWVYAFGISKTADSISWTHSGGAANEHTGTTLVSDNELFYGQIFVDSPLSSAERLAFLDAWVSGSSFGDEVKRFNVDQAASKLYLGTTNTDFWLDCDYNWHELKKYDRITLNDDLYLVNSVEIGDGYQEISLNQDTFIFNRGQNDQSPAVEGTYSPDGIDQDIIYVSGVDIYGRTVDWASANGGSLWLSVDGDTWAEETTVTWGTYDAVGKSQQLSGITTTPAESLYVSLVNPATPSALATDYTTASLRIIPKPVLDASPRTLRGGEWEYVSSTEFRFSEEALKGSHSFPTSGSVFLSTDGSTYSEFFVNSSSVSSGVVTATWGAGSPVWADTPSNLTIAYEDPASVTVSADKPLASFYFHTSDAASTNITDMVNTEGIQAEDRIKVNGVLYDIEEVDVQAGYVRFGVDADLSSITGGSPSTASVEFNHSEQAYTFFNQDGERISDGNLYECYFEMLSKAPAYQWVNPVTGVREADPLNRKVIRLRNSGGEIFELPVQSVAEGRVSSSQVGIQPNPSSSVWGEKSDSSNYSSLALDTGFNHAPGLQERGIRRHRLGTSVEFIDLEQPKQTNKDLPAEEGLTGSAYLLAITDPATTSRSMFMGIDGINYQNTYTFDFNESYSRERENVIILDNALLNPGDQIGAPEISRRRSILDRLPSGTEWWDIGLSAEGHTWCGEKVWKIDRRPWLLDPNYNNALIDNVGIIFDSATDFAMQVEDLGVVTQDEVAVTMDFGYFPFNAGGGGDGGGGGSDRPEFGLIYPRRFG